MIEECTNSEINRLINLGRDCLAAGFHELSASLFYVSYLIKVNRDSRVEIDEESGTILYYMADSLSRLYDREYRKCAFELTGICIDSLSVFSNKSKKLSDFRELRARLWSQTNDFQAAIIEMDHAIKHSTEIPALLSIELLSKSYFIHRLGEDDNQGIFDEVESLINDNENFDSIIKGHFYFRIGIEKFYNNNPGCLKWFKEADEFYDKSDREKVIKFYYRGLLNISHSIALEKFGTVFNQTDEYANNALSLSKFYTGRKLIAGHDPFIYGLGIEKREQILNSEKLLKKIQNEIYLDHSLSNEMDSLRKKVLETVYAFFVDERKLLRFLIRNQKLKQGVFSRIELDCYIQLINKPIKYLLKKTFLQNKFRLIKNIGKSSLYILRW